MRDRERYEKRVGTVVDARWRVDALLGWGSTSAVYAATHRNGHRAALKILHQSLCSDPAMTERFLREAGIANAIKHRAIVPIRDDGMTGEGCAYLVVELLEGETLDAIRERKKGRIALEEFAPIAEELMSALAAVHAAGVVHRDLKPQKIFITTSGDLKLLDFGTARVLDRDPAAAPLSVPHMLVGTPTFMSPEQARGARDEIDMRSDVWSLGAMFFTILSGEPVHPGRDQPARLLAAASKPARKLGDVAPSIDSCVATVVDRALAHAKHERWPDVQAMRVAFRRAVVAAGIVELEPFADARDDDDEASVGTVSLSDPTIALPSDGIETPLAATTDLVVPSGIPRESASEAEMLGVSSTQGLRTLRGGIPLPSLMIGIGAMAAVLLVVVFFVTGGDESRSRAAASPPAPAATTTAESPVQVAPPADAFIVISSPDVPPPPLEEKKKESLPAWATAPTSKALTTTAKTADAGGGGAKAEEPNPKGGAAPGASDVAVDPLTEAPEQP